MSCNTIALIQPEPLEYDNASNALALRNDIFVDIFGLICAKETFFKVTQTFTILKWLDSNLTIHLAELNAVNCLDLTIVKNKTRQYEILEKLQLLKANFIRRIQEIELENIDEALLFTYFQKIQTYFQNISPKDVDFTHHNKDKFIPDLNTSGYLSGLQKDWIERISTLEELFKSAEQTHEKKKKKNSWGSMLSLTSSKKTTNSNAIEGRTTCKAIQAPPSNSPEYIFNGMKEPEPQLDTYDNGENFFLPQSSHCGWVDDYPERGRNNTGNKSMLKNKIFPHIFNGLVLAGISYLLYNNPIIYKKFE